MLFRLGLNTCERPRGSSDLLTEATTVCHLSHASLGSHRVSHASPVHVTFVPCGVCRVGIPCMPCAHHMHPIRCWPLCLQGSATLWTRSCCLRCLSSCSSSAAFWPVLSPMLRRASHAPAPVTTACRSTGRGAAAGCSGRSPHSMGALHDMGVGCYLVNCEVGWPCA